MLQLLAEWGLGMPQFAALLVLAQRGAEELHSARNTEQLLKSGAYEYGGAYYPVVATSHLCWIASLFFIIPSNAEVIWPLVGIYLALQILRYWVILTLGRFWTHRIINLEGAQMVEKGPYRVFRHPNYIITILETLILPLCFGAWSLAIIMSVLWITVIRYKIVLEDEALRARRGNTYGK